ncbi:MAG: hypothetical protein ABR927_03245 [Bacteroidales bacterium]|jgi:hypothetical protein
MTEKIKEFISDPEKLERLYREDKKAFEADFVKIYPEIQDTEMARFWKSRLDFDKMPDKTKQNSGSDIFIMIAVCLFAGFLIKIPDIFNINLNKFPFYEKDAGIIVFLGLTIYAFSINRRFEKKNLAIILMTFVVSIIYINLLPNLRNSSSINLVYIHMPLLMWCAYGLVFIDFDLKNKNKRIEYIKHNGDLAIMGALILIAGALLSGITIGLFKAIGLNIEKFYSHYIIIIGLVAAPVVTTFILKNSASLTNKIAPIIANIFSPLVLITLVVYLIAIAVSGKDPYNDRDFLLTFNIMLIGVMAIIVFSVSETSLYGKQRLSEMVLFILSIVTLIINLIALSAIFYRLGEYGLTPNRLAILGSNILIFINLILIMIDLFRINFQKTGLEKVELTISKYLPVYIIWTIIVVFGFPVLFGMK